MKRYPSTYISFLICIKKYTATAVWPRLGRGTLKESGDNDKLPTYKEKLCTRRCVYKRL